VKRWLAIGAGLLLVVWAPFIYAELTSEPAEKKLRDLPSVAGDEQPVPVPVIEAQDEQAATRVDEAPGATADPTAEDENADEAEEADELELAADESVVEAPADPVPAAPPQPVAEQPEHDDPGEHEEVAGSDDEAQEEDAPPPLASGPTAQLKQAYETEPRDALWATDTERRIASVFSSEDVPEGMLARASCRRAVCSLELHWSRDHATQYIGAFQALYEHFGTEIGVEPVGTIDDEGRQTVHLYVLRKGYTAADVAR
jgi:hypothetical protein